jgi:hypothetical protein
VFFQFASVFSFHYNGLKPFRLCFVDENKNNWQEGLRVFTDISGWIVGPVVAALFAAEHWISILAPSPICSSPS